VLSASFNDSLEARAGRCGGDAFLQGFVGVALWGGGVPNASGVVHSLPSAVAEAQKHPLRAVWLPVAALKTLQAAGSITFRAEHVPQPRKAGVTEVVASEIELDPAPYIEDSVCHLSTVGRRCDTAGPLDTIAELRLRDP